MRVFASSSREWPIIFLFPNNLHRGPSHRRLRFLDPAEARSFAGSTPDWPSVPNLRLHGTRRTPKMKPLAIVYIFFLSFFQLIDIFDFKTNVAHSRILTTNPGQISLLQPSPCPRACELFAKQFSLPKSPQCHNGTLSLIESLSNFALEAM